MHTLSDKRVKDLCGSIRPLKLELSGSQISLVSRPPFKRPSFPSNIKRPMSASSLLMDYQVGSSGSIVRKGSPNWSRPQSADNFCTSRKMRIHNDSRLVPKFTGSYEKSNFYNYEDFYYADDDDDNYSGGSFTNLAANYTSSSSKLVHNMVGSSSSEDISAAGTPSPFHFLPPETRKKLSTDLGFSFPVDNLSDCEITQKKTSKPFKETLAVSSESVASNNDRFTSYKVAAPTEPVNSNSVENRKFITTTSSSLSTEKSSGLNPVNVMEVESNNDNSTDGRVSFNLQGSNLFIKQIESVDRETGKSVLLTSLEPGLASKPPLPPTPDYLRNLKSPILTTSCNINSGSCGNDSRSNKGPREDDEIINLKFQRWFPNSVIHSKETFIEDSLDQLGSKSDTNFPTNNSHLGLSAGENSNDDISVINCHKKDRQLNLPSNNSDTYADDSDQYWFSKERDGININSDKETAKEKLFDGIDPKQSIKTDSGLGKENVKKLSKKFNKGVSISSLLSKSVKEKNKFHRTVNQSKLPISKTDSFKNKKSKSLSRINSHQDKKLGGKTFKSNQSATVGDDNFSLNKDIRDLHCDQFKSNKSAIVDDNNFSVDKNIRDLNCDQGQNLTTKSVNNTNDLINYKSNSDFKTEENIVSFNTVNSEQAFEHESVLPKYTFVNDDSNSDNNQFMMTYDNKLTENSNINNDKTEKPSTYLHFEERRTPDNHNFDYKEPITTTEANFVNNTKMIISSPSSAQSNRYSSSPFSSSSNKMLTDSYDNNCDKFLSFTKNNSHIDENDTELQNKSNGIMTTPIICVSDESENAINGINEPKANDNSNFFLDIYRNTNQDFVLSNSVNSDDGGKSIPSVVEYNHNSNYLYNSVTELSDANNVSSVSDDSKDHDSVIKKFIKTRLAVSSEYIIKTMKPKADNSKITGVSASETKDYDKNKSETLHVSGDLIQNNSGNSLNQTTKVEKMQQSFALSCNEAVNGELVTKERDEIPERDLNFSNNVGLVSRQRKEYCGDQNVYISSEGASMYNDIVNILRVLETEEEADRNLINLPVNRLAIPGCESIDVKCVKNNDKKKLPVNSNDIDGSCKWEETFLREGKVSSDGDFARVTAILNYLDESDRKSEEAVKIKKTSPNVDVIQCKIPSLDVTQLFQSSNRLCNVKNDFFPNRSFEVTDHVTIPKTPHTQINSTRNNVSGFVELMALSAPELTQQVILLTTELEQKIKLLDTAEEQLNILRKSFESYKSDNESAVKRHQAFIDQLLIEKKSLADQCSSVIKEMESKHLDTIKCLEDRHKVELKKACDKTAAAEKIKRDRWVDMKTKKIKELTIKGLEPELNRMATAHQEELAELRKAHQRQLEEAEATFNRRVAALRTQADADKEQAVLREREAARNRLEQEIVELDKSYQEQRRKLLAEIRSEREQMQKENFRVLAEKEGVLQEKMERISKETLERLEQQENFYQIEIERMRNVLEAEKEAWVTRQKVEWVEKEKAFREECKRERDKEIDLAIRKLETESSSREQIMQNKLRREKERYEGEMKEMENIQKELRQKLKLMRDEVNLVEEKNAQLNNKLSKIQSEYDSFKQVVEKQMNDHDELIRRKESEAGKQTVALRLELKREQAEFQQQMKNALAEKESELQRVFARVKEVVSKKDEAINLVEKQRDVAIKRCSELETLLNQREMLKNVTTGFNKTKISKFNK